MSSSQNRRKLFCFSKNTTFNFYSSPYLRNDNVTCNLNQLVEIPELQQRLALYDDMAAYRQLYDYFYGRLHRTAYSFVKSKEAAEEIVSDVFIKIWQIRTRLTEIDNLVVYLYTITKNFSLNYITRHYKYPVTDLDHMPVETFVEFNTPDEICISADIIAKIRAAIKELPPKCQIILQLVKEDGLRYREVATILGISELTVRNQLAIAVKKLAQALPVYLHPSLKLNFV